MECPTLNVDAIAHELDLINQAQKNGSYEIPSSDSTQFDGPQELVVKTVREEAMRVLSGYLKTLKGYNEKILKTDIRIHLKEVENIDTALRNALSDLDDKYTPQVSDAQTAYDKELIEYGTFRQKNRITREPKYPDSHLWLWAMILVAWVGEGIINAFFFQQGMMQGLVGGFAMAFLLAGVDVFCVFWMGRLVAWFASAKLAFKAIAASTLAVFIIWAVAYNLLTAHVREQLHGDRLLSEASKEALSMFLSSPLGLQQADSWILVFIGVAFSIMALVSGLQWDEKIPFYGKRHRQLKALEEDKRFFLEAHRERAKQIYESKLQRLDMLLKEAHGILSVLRHDIEMKEVLYKNVTNCIGHYDDTCKALIRVYRDHNLRHRTTPPPAYFDKPISIDLQVPEEFSVVADTVKLEQQEDAYERMRERLENKKAELEKIYRDYVRRWLYRMNNSIVVEDIESLDIT
ncbi:hypothetical protein [Rhodocaloribacter sp.]